MTFTKVKTTKNKNDKSIHYSVGALIKRDGKYLLIDRTKKPFGFAGWVALLKRHFQL